MATSILRAARALLAIVLASGPALPALGRDSLIASMASAVERDEVERASRRSSPSARAMP